MNKLVLVASMPLLLLGACERVDGDAAEPADATTTTRAGTQPAETGTPGASESMDAELSIAENLDASSDLATLNQAIESAGLAETLAGIGPYTLFAPTDVAFAAADAGALIENGGPELVSLVSNHLVPGVITAADLKKAVDDGDGSTQLATMTGALLTVSADGDDLLLASGDSRARITGTDLAQANGMVHVVDGVLAP